MKNMRLFFLACSVIVFDGCSEPRENSAGAQVREASRVASEIDQDIQSILSEAQALYESAQEKEHAWIVTRKLLASAREGLSSGDQDAAMVDAKRALITAQASVVQADKPASDWRARVPR